MMTEYFALKKLILENKEFQTQVKQKTVTFKKDQTILTFNKIYPSFYFIKKGSVKIVLLEGHFGVRGKIAPIVTTLNEYNIFGEFGLFDNCPAVGDVISIIDTELIEIDKSSFIEFLNNHKEIGYDVLIELFESMCCQIRIQNKNFYHLINKVDVSKLKYDI